MVRIANNHFVTPALWRSLEGKGLAGSAPSEVQHFLRHIYAANEDRNKRLRAQAVALIRILNEGGIVPLLLKGGHHLFEAADEDLGSRMMIDLDVAVRQADLESTFRTLDQAKYQAMAQEDDWRSHDRAYFRPGDVAGIEIHRSIGMQRRILSCAAAFEGASLIEIDGIRVRALSPTDRVLHNVFHHQLQNRKQTFGLVHLRDLLDTALLAERHGDAIDWARVSRSLRARREGRALRSYVYMAHRLLGTKQPGDIPATNGARLHLLRCEAQIRHASFMRAMQFLAGLTHPFARCYIEYSEKCEGRAITVNYHRIKRGVRVLRKYRTRAFKITERRRRDFYQA